MLVAFIAFNIFVWTICLGFSVHNLIQAGQAHAGLKGTDGRGRLPNYTGVEWAKTHFAEFNSLRSKYVSFLGWRRELYTRKTVTLVGPYALRATVGTGEPGKPTVYFFGWWERAQTTPARSRPWSRSSAASGRSTMASSGWVAHQSLALLIRLLQEGHRPDVVVFYDGANEVAHKCRRELTPTSHAREEQIRSALAERRAEHVYGLQYMAGPLIGLGRVVSGSVRGWFRNESEQFACHTDAARAQQIADGLVQDWDTARRLVQSYGARFIGVLQPVAYCSDTKLDHIRLSSVQKQQFEAVYPLIRQRMLDHPGLHDFAGVLDQQEYIYIDFCHLSPNGNRYIADKLVKVLEHSVRSTSPEIQTIGGL